MDATPPEITVLVEAIIVKYYFYKIENNNDHKAYIGVTTNLQIRRNKHFNFLRQNKHWNPKLQEAYNRNGLQAFTFEQIDEMDTEDEELAYNREKELIIEYDSVNSGYNVVLGKHGRPSSAHFTEEQVYQILAANYFTKRCGTKIAECIGCPRGTISNITRGINYHDYYLNFHAMTDDEKHQYYEDFCGWTDFRERQYKAHINSLRTRSKDEVWFILWVDKTRKITLSKMHEILHTTRTGTANIRKGICYPDYYHEFQQLTDEQLMELESHYMATYNLQIP